MSRPDRSHSKTTSFSAIESCVSSHMVNRRSSAARVDIATSSSPTTHSSSSFMPSRAKYPPRPLATTDPYADDNDDDDAGPNDAAWKHPESPMRRFLNAGGARKHVVLSTIALLGLYLIFTYRSHSRPTLRNVAEGGTAVGGSGTRLDEFGRPVAPAIADHDFDQQAKPPGSQSSGGKAICVPPPGKPAHQYALMIDAGSTGSRIHVYRFAYCASSPTSTARVLPTLQDEQFFKLTPGLSSFAGRPQEAAESLRELMQSAVENVPEDQRKCTPIAVKATAGLRLLGERESTSILDEVERWLTSEWPFPLVTNGVAIMDGSDEGVYAWVTINYLLHLIGPTTSDNSTAAVMDLGGASTQIVFEPTFASHSSSSKTPSLEPGDHVYDLTFASHHHALYQHSHLGYGLMQGRRSVHNFIAFSYIWQSQPQGHLLDWDELTTNIVIPNPCLVKGGKKVVELDPPGRSKVSVTFEGTGAGFEACRRIVDVVMAKDAVCTVEPCAFGGVYQPNLMDTFEKGPIYALSYFYDRIAPLGVGPVFRMSDLRTLTVQVCQGPNSQVWKDRFSHSKEALSELQDRPEYCLDLSFMYSLLSLGYELADDREIIISKKIDGVELGWALGAAIAMLDGKIECKA